MDYNQYQTIYEERPTKARDFRKIARKSLKGFWWTAVLVTLVASLLGGVAVGGSSFNFGSTGTMYEDDSYYEDEYDPEYSESVGIIGGAEDSVVLTPEETEELEAAIKNFDLETVGNILSETYPTFGFLIGFFGIIFVAVIVFALAFSIFVSSPVKVGYQRFCLEVLDGNESEIRVGTLFNFFKQSYFKTIGLNIVHGLLIELTWIPMLVCMAIGGVSFASSLVPMLYNPMGVSDIAVMGGLLAFVGLTFLGMAISLCINIPVSYMYSMAHIIMADYPSVGAIEALRLSRQMMKGNKWRLFCLDFSFIGWALLAACCTCGIGYYFLTPYQYVARAAFYHEISGRKTPEDVEFPSVDPDDYQV